MKFNETELHFDKISMQFVHQCQDILGKFNQMQTELC